MKCGSGRRRKPGGFSGGLVCKQIPALLKIKRLGKEQDFVAPAGVENPVGFLAGLCVSRFLHY
jgi:hypothetical protein